MGQWQFQIENNLLNGYTVDNPLRYLKSAKYTASYKKSFLNLRSKLEKQGYFIVKCLGPRNGDYSACYKIINISK